MLVAERSQQSEMRVLYGLLARAAMERFDAPTEVSGSRDIYFLNLLRLLDMYRFDALRNAPSVGIFESTDFQLDDLESEDDAETIARALVAAQAAVRPSLDKEAFVIEMKTALESILMRGSQGTDPDAIEFARKFLTRLSEELKQTS